VRISKRLRCADLSLSNPLLGSAAGSRVDAPTPIRIPKTAEVVADSIRRMITSGKLSEGDTLSSEARIIEQFEVCRPTVREAIRILESEGLLSVSRGSRTGARVHLPKAQQLARYAGFILQTARATYADVYRARVMIEPPAARYVAEARSKDAPAILRAVIATQRALYETDEFGRAVASFHARLIELTDNKMLILISSMLEGVVGRFQSDVTVASRALWTKGRRSMMSGLKSQGRLVDLIAAGDGPGAEAHWRVHMENSSRVWLGAGARDAIVDWQE
jgi:DNA-binding FadR family transcriptional regulator